MRGEAEAAIAGVAQKVAVSGGTVAVFGGLTANEIAAIGGLLVALVGLCVQVYYKRKEDRRNQRLHDARMQGWMRLGDDDGEG